MQKNVARLLLAEFIGTAVLLCAVIGSGIMGERLSPGNVGIALLANTLATVFILYVLIEALGPVSGAHFNPVVSVVLAARGKFGPHDRLPLVALFILAQLAGAILGAAVANVMFDLDVVHVSTRIRTGPSQWFAEAVAAAGLLFVILRAPQGKASILVACYIGAAYWFTASTSFANPAAVMGRMLSNTFSGIAPASALGFVAAQFVGGAAGALLSWCFDPPGLTP